MEEAISLKEALAIIHRKSKDETPHPFDVTVRSLNRNSKTGGRLKVYEGAKLLVNNGLQSGKAKLLENVAVKETFKKNPNHWTNRTRNIILPDGQIRKIHIRLIISINNQKVVY